MSMTTMLVLRAAEVLILYNVVTLLLPYLCFRKKLKAYPFSVGFMACLIMGNFYIINMVQILELCHISYIPTLILGTFAPCIFLFFRRNKGHILETVTGWSTATSRFIGGKVGGRTMWHIIGRNIRDVIKKAIKSLGAFIKKHPVDFFLTLAVIAGVLYMYGSNLTITYGYISSDLPVHNYWVNALGKNKIYVAGVYPFGYHIILYYIHELFHIPTYVVIRVFSLTQTMMVHLTMLAFMRRIFKSPVFPYLATLAFTFINLVSPDVYSRLYSTLPQEFGRIFILPAMYFIIRFFRWMPVEPKKDARRFLDRKTCLCLTFFALGFSLTLTSHFYNTIVAGVFCLGIAGGHLIAFLKPRYFRRIMLTGIISVVIAVIPMAVAVAMGTKLEGSLIWALGVMNGGEKKAEETAVKEEVDDEGNITFTGTEGKVYTYQYKDDDGKIVEISTFVPAGVDLDTIQVGATGKTVGDIERAQNGQTAQGGVAQAVKNKSESILKRVGGIVKAIPHKIEIMLNGVHYVTLWWLADGLETTVRIFLYALPVPIVLGLLFLALREREYAENLLTIGFTMCLLFLMMGGKHSELPSLMDENRSASYVYQLLPLLFGISVDGIFYLMLKWFKNEMVVPTVTFITTIIASMAGWKYGLLRTPSTIGAMELNDAMTCMFNVMTENKDFTWVIVSANDEFRMMEDYGYHYETIEFLLDMEGYKSNMQVLLEVPEVYFFVEKTPVGKDENGNGYRISDEWASMELPKTVSTGAYVNGRNRNVVMSRMYYWAERFMELYPNEMDVFYETDTFVCYHITQNMYSLYNFAIDYGYNE